MKNAVVLALIVLGLAGCTTPASPDHREDSAAQVPTAAAAPLPRTYWPLDTTVEQRDTVLAGRGRYHIRVVTTCLNDSAVINPITSEAGPALAVSHNYQSELYVARGQQPWLHERLTKALFQHNPIAQSLDSVQNCALSRTAFLRYQHGEFRFYTRLSIPDSDIFVEAEVALMPGKGLRLVRVRPSEGSDK